MWGRTVLPIVLCVVCGGFNMGLAGEVSPLVKEAVSALGHHSKPDMGLLKNIANTLPKLRKHLILEQTRGVKEIEVYRRAVSSVVLIQTDLGEGAGSIIDVDGHVLTNWHVIDGASSIAIALKPENAQDLKTPLWYTATVEKTNRTKDLALLRMSTIPSNGGSIRLGKFDELQVGQDVFAIGHPEGQVWSFTSGIISQIRPNFDWVDHHATVIQSQAPINPGNSGGPLLDEKGHLIGVNSFNAPKSQGLNYAVSVNEVHTFLASPGDSKDPQPSTQQTQLHCPDVYDTLGGGWDNIGGCYNQKGTAPPPDYWVVKRDPEGTQYYAVLGSKEKTLLDTVFQGSTTHPGEIDWDVDTDCDGMVDVLGYQPAGSDKVERYQYPPEPYSITSQAKELHQALINFRIPLSSVQFCQ